jgi:hypothetical protein
VTEALEVEVLSGRSQNLRSGILVGCPQNDTYPIFSRQLRDKDDV